MQQCTRCKQFTQCSNMCTRKERQSNKNKYDILCDMYDIYHYQEYFYCDECGPKHVGLQCFRCQKIGCGHDVWRCDLCSQLVCFNSEHSLRISGFTCCVECCESRVDLKNKMIALIQHFPPEILGHIGYELLKLDPLPYKKALLIRYQNLKHCVDCGTHCTVQLRRIKCKCSRPAKRAQYKCIACYDKKEWTCKKCNFHS
jgi:hypothetical protein